MLFLSCITNLFIYLFKKNFISLYIFNLKDFSTNFLAVASSPETSPSVRRISILCVSLVERILNSVFQIDFLERLGSTKPAPRINFFFYALGRSVDSNNIFYHMTFFYSSECIRPRM